MIAKTIAILDYYKVSCVMKINLGLLQQFQDRNFVHDNYSVPTSYFYALFFVSYVP